ncbi:MAG: CPBP family intramembrane glutamic endopeptidase [Chloroflexota bacterium]
MVGARLTALRHALVVHAPPWPWVCLTLIAVAELLSSGPSPRAGVLLHGALLAALIAGSCLLHGEPNRTLALTLALAPLIRLLSFSMPLSRLPQIVWYPIIGAPLVLAAGIVLGQTRLPRAAVGLRLGSLPVQLAVASCGFSLGTIEFAILRPAPLVESFTLAALILPAIGLLLFTGFVEELIFRGLLQAAATRAMGYAGLYFVALLFAALHIGYLSVLDAVFVFAVGLLFAYIVLRSGSILGVTLAHGLTNIMLFLVLPHLAANPDHPLAPVASAAAWLGAAALVAALAAMSRTPPRAGARHTP